MCINTCVGVHVNTGTVMHVKNDVMHISTGVVMYILYIVVVMH